jgi:hypothetical protein
MSDVKDLLDEATGSYERRPDQEAVERRVERRRRSRRMGAGFFALGIFLVAGWFSWSAFRTVGNVSSTTDSGTYLLTGFEVTPHLDPATGEVDPAHADVTFTTDWSTVEYPGDHRCYLQVFDSMGSQIGSLSFEMLSLSQGHHNPQSVPVVGPIDGATATGSCSDERLDTPVAAIISDVRVEDASTVSFVVGWPDTISEGGSPGSNACTTALFAGGEFVAKEHFTLAGGHGPMKMIITRPEQFFGEDLEATIVCVPYVHENQFPDPKPLDSVSPSPSTPLAVTESPTATVTVVPSVIGLSAETARQVLSDAGLEVRTEIVPGTYKDAAIIEQTPSGGSRVDPRGRVTIVIGPAANVAETASDVLHVTCQPDGTATVQSAAVQAQADGLHVVVDDQAGAEAVVFTRPSEPWIAWSSGSNGLDGEFVSLVAPGETTARCEQAGTTYDTSQGDSGAATFVVLDPNAYWTSSDLACGPLDDSWAMTGLQPVDPLVTTIYDAARMAAPGIRDTDIVESAGYTASRADAGLVRVARDGQVIAWLRDAFAEGWSFDGYACPGSGIGGQ